MHIKTILNRVERQPGFVYERFKLLPGDRPALEIALRAKAGSRPICSGCGKPGPGYDTLAQRRFAFVPMWGILVFFLYRPRRVDCPRCGRIKVEKMPWANGKHRLTTTYAWFLATWAKRMSWKEVATAFMTSWDSVFRSVKMAVEWGLAHRNLDGITAVGTDEICGASAPGTSSSLWFTSLMPGKNGCSGSAPTGPPRFFGASSTGLGRNGAKN